MSTGSAQAVTDVNGRYQLTGVPAGSVTLQAQRAGFNGQVETIVLAEGSNTHDIVLTRQSLFTRPGVAVYVPPEVSSVRAVLIVLAFRDTRGLATDVYDDLPGWWQPLRRDVRSLASAQGLAIMGSEFLPDSAPSDARLLAALEAVALASGRPELEQAPLFVWGVSGGDPEAFGLTVRHPERVVGLVVTLSSTLNGQWRAPPVLADQDVPGHVLLGGIDRADENDFWRQLFERHRAAHALWALTIDPGVGHELSNRARAAMVGWVGTVLQLRLPATSGSPVPLRRIEESSGWLGNRTTYAIAAYADYTDDRLRASWLPSEATARTWQALVTADSVRPLGVVTLQPGRRDRANIGE